MYSALLVLKFSGFSSIASPSQRTVVAKSLSNDRLAQDINLRPNVAPVNVARPLWFSRHLHGTEKTWRYPLVICYIAANYRGIYRLNMVIFNSYVKLPECTYFRFLLAYLFRAM